ncbi:MAG: hypothetical protein K2Q22_07330 [Cytophagales bacterium]|nr:hypothetical protein [Cytophagales bacterium]
MKFQLLVISFVLLICFGGCKRNLDSEVFTGPTAIINFTASGLNTTTADFANSAQAIYYQTKFNQPTYWQVKIKGLQSGGVKIFSGYGTSVDISNSAWYGNSDSLFFFRDGEKCLVTLQVSGIKEPKVDTILLTTARQFPADHFAIVNSFDDLSYVYNESLNSYFGDTLDYTTDPMIVSSISSSYNTDTIGKLIQGQGIGYFVGDLQNVPGKYLFGGTYFPANLGAFPDGGANPDSIFINIIAKSAPAPYGCKLTLQLQEVETEFKKHPEWVNQPGDIWAYDTPVLTTDWQVYSIRYSLMAPGFQTDGNSKPEPQKINQLNLGFVAEKAGGKMKCYVDFYVITYGKPFRP